MAVSERLAPSTTAPPAPRAGALGRRAWKLTRRWLYVIHRWAGIATCLLCAMWFVSGVVMMYVPFPSVTERERMAFSAPVDWAQVRVAPDAAVRAAGFAEPTQVRLTMFRGTPVYRVAAGRKSATVSAVDGLPLGRTGAEGALDVVRRARPDAPNPTIRSVRSDQWTVAQGFTPHRPLWRVDLGDRVGTQLYVSSRTGEIVDDTTRGERFWNWLGAVPHWIYFEAIRRDGPSWRQWVMWTSGPTAVGAVLGIWIGILRLRLRRRYAGDRVSPYAGWMKWHHVSGLVAGLFVVTWLFSGWLSVNPFGWFDRQPASKAGTLAYLGGSRPGGLPAFSPDPAVLRGLPAGWAREARLAGFAGRPLWVLQDAGLRRRVFDGRSGAEVRLSDAEVFAAAARLVPGARVVHAERLTAEDDYWYTHGGERPTGRLPMLRVRFDDRERTWAHIDPQTGEVVNRSGASARTYRWLFNALHDFDLRFLLHHRPLWDLVVLALSAGGLIVSVSGVVIGWRRLGRKLASARAPG